MKRYKKDLLKGFEERRFELSELQGGESLPWWIEEKWILSGAKSDSRIVTLYVNFLMDKQWQGGNKIVDEVLITKTEMENYSDCSSKVVEWKW